MRRHKGFHDQGLIQLTWEDACIAADHALRADFRQSPTAAAAAVHDAVGVLVLKDCLPSAERGDAYGVDALHV
jgi:putative chitinase